MTGGGWIDSPPGAYAADPTMIGKATFGFVAKARKGQTIPDGNTEFQFHAAKLNFKSQSYEWLVVSGSKATFKGVGTLNGAGEAPGPTRFRALTCRSASSSKRHPLRVSPAAWLLPTPA